MGHVRRSTCRCPVVDCGTPAKSIGIASQAPNPSESTGTARRLVPLYPLSGCVVGYPWPMCSSTKGHFVAKVNCSLLTLPMSVLRAVHPGGPPISLAALRMLSCTPCAPAKTDLSKSVAECSRLGCSAGATRFDLSKPQILHAWAILVLLLCPRLPRCCSALHCRLPCPLAARASRCGPVWSRR